MGQGVLAASSPVAHVGRRSMPMRFDGFRNVQDVTSSSSAAAKVLGTMPTAGMVGMERMLVKEVADIGVV